MFYALTGIGVWWSRLLVWYKLSLWMSPLSSVQTLPGGSTPPPPYFVQLLPPPLEVFHGVKMRAQNKEAEKGPTPTFLLCGRTKTDMEEWIFTTLFVPDVMNDRSMGSCSKRWIRSFFKQCNDSQQINMSTGYVYTSAFRSLWNRSVWNISSKCHNSSQVALISHRLWWKWHRLFAVSTARLWLWLILESQRWYDQLNNHWHHQWEVGNHIRDIVFV